MVDHALCVVRVTGAVAARRHVLEAPGELGVLRVLDVDHVKPTTAGLAATAAADGVCVPGVLIDHDVVGAVNAIVTRVLGERHRLRPIEATKVGQVEDLHPMLARVVRDDEHVVVVDLHVPPHGHVRSLRHRQATEVERRARVGHVDKGGLVRHTNEHDLATALGVGPTPHVIGVDAALGLHVTERDE